MTTADHANTVRAALLSDTTTTTADVTGALAALNALQAQAEERIVPAEWLGLTQKLDAAEAERDHLRKELRSAGDVAWALGEERDRLADALRDVQKRIPVWGQGMTDTDWRDAHRVLEVARAALARTEQP